MKRLLFFDIDGTLVSFKNHKIPQSTILGLTRAKEKGADIYIATGRPYGLIDNIEGIKHLIDGYITANGAYCFAGNQEISCYPIPTEQVVAIIELSDKMGFACMIVGEQNIIMRNNNSLAEHIFQNMLNVPKFENSVSLQTILGQRILQITPVISTTEEHLVLSSLNNIASSRWCPEFIDITANGINKAIGMKDIVAWRNYPGCQTIAFGDGGNDVSIIKEAEIGIAMGNSDETVRSAADYVTCSVDDNGVYHALKYLNVI